MALDPYSPCPAGTGKKLKFCCSDLTGELEKIQRMLEGDQRQACLDHIAKLQEKYPDRPCLLTSQALIQLGLGQVAEARSAVERVLQVAPANPVALAESALLAMTEGELSRAIETLQLAISACPQPMPATVVDVISSIAEGLVTMGHVPAALGHMLLVASILPQDESTLGLIVRLNSSPQVPLLFKEEPDFQPAPAGVPWQALFDEAVASARQGTWRSAADKLAGLAVAAPDAPAIWRNLATLRMWLTDDAGALDALRRLAALDLPEDDRVEAEATAQLIDPRTTSERVDLLRIEYPIKNIDELIERLSDRRVATTAVDPTPWTDRNEAPPRLAFVLLDRQALRTGADLKREDVPNVLGHLLVFGRQTDREAHLDLSLARPNREAAVKLLESLCGDSLGPAGADEKHGDLASSQWALSWNWRLPEDITPDKVHHLLVEQRRQSILDAWTKTPLGSLDGKTPAEAAKDDAQRIPLLAAILILELSFQEASVGPVFDELRTQLGLPPAAKIDPTTVDVEHVPLARLHRVDWSQADDDALLTANRRAMFAAAHLALRATALAILARETLQEKIQPAQVYGLLARLEDDTTRAIGYIDQARQAAGAIGQSCARWDLEELSLRFERGEANEFGRLLQHIQTQHSREPGVAQALMQILVEAGLVTPDGRPARGAAEEASPLVVPGAATEPGKLWTPESEAGPGKKSALWVPGSE